MFTRISSSIVVGLISTSAYAYTDGLEISALSQLTGEEVKATYVGEPILASKSGGAIFHFNKSGEENDYYWVNQENRVLAKGVVFIPSLMDAGSQVRLCQSIVVPQNQLEERVQVDCSNSLLVEHTNLSIDTRTLRSGTFDINDIWDLKQDVANDIPIYSQDDSIKLELTLSYTGELLNIEDVLSSNEPKLAKAFFSIQDQDNNYLVSPQRYYPEDQHFVHNDLTEKVLREPSVNLGDASVINVCGFGLATVGASPAFSLGCDKRVVEADDQVVYWGKSPTAEQFATLFPEHSYIRSRSINGVFYAASPLISNSENLQDKYCESIGSNYASPSTEELLLLKSAGDGYNTATWPSFTNYWSNDEVAGPYPIPGISWNNTVIVSGDNSIQAADNATYHGLFSCLKQN